MKKGAVNSTLSSSTAQELRLQMPLNFRMQYGFVCISQFFKHDIKRMHTQGLRFNKINPIDASSRIFLSELDLCFLD